MANMTKNRPFAQVRQQFDLCEKRFLTNRNISQQKLAVNIPRLSQSEARSVLEQLYLTPRYVPICGTEEVN